MQYKESVSLPIPVEWKRPVVVWVGITNLLVSGMVFIMTLGIVVYAAFTGTPEGDTMFSIEDLAYAAIFVTVGITCLIAASLVFARLKLGRKLAIFAAIITFTTFLYSVVSTMLGPTSEDTESALIGIAAFFSIVAILLGSAILLLCFGKKVNAYFKTSV